MSTLLYIHSSLKMLYFIESLVACISDLHVQYCLQTALSLMGIPHNRTESMGYSGTSDKGPSEKRRAALERTVHNYYHSL